MSKILRKAMPMIFSGSILLFVVAFYFLRTPLLIIPMALMTLIYVLIGE